MLWIIFLTIIFSTVLSFFLGKKIITKEKINSQTVSPFREEADSTKKTLSLFGPGDAQQEHITAQEARHIHDIHLMLQALNHEQNPINRHLLYRDIIAQSFPQRHRDPKMRELFMATAQAHIQEMPEIISDLVDRFGSKPYFFTFSYYAIALTEALEFDQAMEVCRLALAHGAKDGLGVGFDKRIELIAQRKARTLASQAA